MMDCSVWVDKLIELILSPPDTSSILPMLQIMGNLYIAVLYAN